jgi:hypothetical protein
LAAYYRESPAVQDCLGGAALATPPPCPWKDLGTALGRDRQVAVQLEQPSQQPVPASGVLSRTDGCS